MSKVQSYILLNQEKGKDLINKQQAEMDALVAYPDFNKWVEELEKNPDYIEQVEKNLDEELGKNRIF
jgi:hypothetical protein